MADRVARIVLGELQSQGLTRKELLAGGVTGLVESGFRNLSYGHADSQGWRQERARYFKNPRNLRASARRFAAGVKALRGKGLSVGELAQAVQKSAHPERYQQRLGDARRLLRSLSVEGGGGADGVITTVTRFQPPQTHIDARAALRDALLSGGKNPVLAASSGIAAGRYTTTTPGRTVTTSQRAPEVGGGGGRVGNIAERANIVDRARPPYKWGGGHGSRPAELGVPVDCSGAVSQVLGINPRVSGAFNTVGRPGRQRGGRVFVYYNAKHVLMEINGRFWGTSGANPRGGAGWIPRNKISKSYLRGFRVRTVA